MIRPQRGPAQPASIGASRRHALVSRIVGSMGIAGLSCAAAFGQGVLTYHADSSRTGWVSNETVLTPQQVASGRFGKLFTHDVDGAIYGQPLVVPGVRMADGSVHDLVLVVTQHDGVWAFDADDAAATNALPLWYISFLAEASPGVTVQPVPSGDVACEDISPEIGITSTPVVDPTTGTAYVEAKTKETSSAGIRYVQRLHALDLSTGQEMPGSPVEIAAAAPGTAPDADSQGLVHFDPLRNLQRPGLLLLGGAVYLGFGSHCDVQPYHGWLLAYDEASLAQVGALCITPDGSEGSLWNSGCAPAVDQAGNVFVVTSNGTFTLNTGGTDASDSFLRIAGVAGGMNILDSFTPYDQDVLAEQDLDLGSGGIMLLPDQPTGPPHLAIGGGKDGTLYVVNRDNLGGFQPTSNNVFQSLPAALAGLFSTPTLFGNTVFIGDSGYFGAPLRAFQLVAGQGLVPAAVPMTDHVFAYPGAGLAVSSAGSEGGVLWALEHTTPAILYAYDPADLSHVLYSTDQATDGVDQPGTGVRFAVPTVWNGKVYVGTMERLAVYGLRTPVALRRKLTAQPPH